MIAATPVSAKIVTCRETDVDAYLEGESVIVSFLASIDLALCLRESVVTLLCEVVKREDQISVASRTIEQINAQLLGSASSNQTRARDETVLASRRVDLTALIPNTIVSGLPYGKLTREEITRTFTPKSRVVPSSVELTVRTDEKRSSDRQSVHLLRDPSSQNLGAYPLDTVQSIAGTALLGRRVEVIPPGSSSTRIALQDSSTVSVLVASPYPGDRQSLVGSTLRITAFSRDLELQVVSLRPDFSSRLASNTIPSVAPVVYGNVNEYGRTTVTVTQVDPMADSITISARMCKDYDTPTEGFVTIADRILCSPGQTVSVPVGIAGPAIVRVHPARADRVAAVFGSAVVGKSRRGSEKYEPGDRTRLIAVNSSTGISLDLLTNDLRASAALIRKKDIRSGEVTYVLTSPQPISTIKGLIDDSVPDLAVIQYHVDLYRSNGDVVRDAALSNIISRIDPRGIVSAQISANPVVTGNQVVQLSVTPTIKQNDVNFLIDYVRSIGLEAAFQTDLETLRKSLLNCLKFDVTRIDMQTGEAKYVGQTSSSIVDDIDDVKIKSTFLYVFDAFVRSPSQLTDVIDDRANRPTGINPQITRLGLHITKADVDGISGIGGTLSNARKFFSRSNFETGTMPADPAKDGFRDGRTGDVFMTTVVVNPVMPTVSSVSVFQNRTKPVISWRVTGNPSLIDRFIISAKSSGSTWQVATAGFTGTETTMQITDTSSYTLPRYLTYAVTPIYLDGSAGEAALSETALLEKTREV